jgi:LacI family transcriptional regulator
MPGSAPAPSDVYGGREATIRDVAAEAGVAISTVSLVMNGGSAVRQSTRERVLRAASTLGYVPRSAARQLARRQTGNVGFVLREDHFMRGEPFYTRIFLGSEFEARTAGVYVLLTTIPDAYRPGVDTPRFLRERNVDGLVVAGSAPAAFFEEVARVGLPLVLVDFEHGGLPGKPPRTCGRAALRAWRSSGPSPTTRA